MTQDAPKVTFLKDYRPPAWMVKHIDMTVRIFEEKTIVRAVTQVEKNHDGNEPLVFDGEHMTLLSVMLDGAEPEHKADDKALTITNPGKDSFTLEIETEFNPAENTRLMGLYKSQGNWCTQCEAEGFRSITYYPDRPDVMATFNVRIEADKTACPVLLSNGDLGEEGDLENGRHYAVWNDPFPKPPHLFALVAGDLQYIQGNFTTAHGRSVDLRIYVRDGDQDQCWHAMESLKHSMKWDEDLYGRIYEYDRFNIVAVSDFNMGAMENTTLNIFNTALVLAHPETATDRDFEAVEAVIAHEYFHNWTGNRVTCRDWFQLSLKEGLTVFRDQSFSADMNSTDVQRIDDVTVLRGHQFTEDASPLSHPVRPDNYIEINNFYTATVYDKGAEVIRMQHAMLGPKTYRKATDLYFDRHDGQAVTCEDFVKCMEDASDLDLSQFFRWYEQAGTPKIKASGSYDEAGQTYTLTLSQETDPTPGQPEKKPYHIPVKIGLVGPDGEDMAADLLHLKEPEQSFTFENIPAKPVPSLLREFSAPVRLKTDLSDDDLRFLMVNDNDGFNKWEAGQMLAHRMIARMLDANSLDVEPAFLDSMGSLLDSAFDPATDKALLARSMGTPSIAEIGQTRDVIDPQAIYEVKKAIRDTVCEQFGGKLRDIHADNDDAEFANDFEARSRRSLKNIALAYLDDGDLANAQYEKAHNMTDRVAALATLTDHDVSARSAAYKDYYERFKDYQLVMDKWFALQCIGVRDDTVDAVRALTEHPDFTLSNPNRVRSVYAAFAMSNPVCFHRADGSGYEFLTEAIIALNTKNPQIASRLVTPMREWKRYTADRQDKMKAQLERLKALPELSPDVFEVVNKTLRAA